MKDSIKIQSYLFVPASEIKSLLKSKEMIISSKTIRIIDLEDSIKDPIDNKNSENLKNNAREFLKEYLPTDNQNFHLRINSFNSASFNEDIKLISDLNKKINFNFLCEGIVLPKTNSIEEIKNLELILKEMNLGIKIIPLIETIRGMNNFDEITHNPKIKSVMFGHHDYFYEKEIFPIPNTTLTSKEYRNTLHNMLESLKDTNVEFIDGICPYLDNQEIMKDSCRYLYQQAPELNLGKITLNPSQVEAVSNIDNWNKELSINSEDDEVSSETKINLAKETIELYKNRSKLNLGVGKVEGKYISPQQFYLAEKILKENDEKTKELNNFKIH